MLERYGENGLIMHAQAASTLQALSFRRRYSTGRDDLLNDFYLPCLAAAMRYDRAVGFFSSTFYLLTGGAFADFARRGGTMRIVCCPRLSEIDVAAMRDGYKVRAAGNGVLRELDDCLTDPVGRAVATLLATLVARAVLDVHVAFRPGATGIYHDKVGIFTDGGGVKVSFDGSANESWSAWSARGNHEAFHAFTSWVDPERVHDDVDYFESLWNNREPGIEVIPFPLVARERLEELADPEGIAHAERRVQDTISARDRLPAAGRPRLRRHQQSVLDDWVTKSYRGIVEHATGSGKTITALTAASMALAAGCAALMVVPSISLLEQWRQEARQYFGDSVQLMLAGSGHNEWRSGANLRNFLEPGTQRIAIATIDTAAAPEFTRRLRGLHPLCLLIDEVHRAGSANRQELLVEIDADWRLGLSATWQREGDPTGTAAILDYFGPVLTPVYTLKDAVDDGYLTPYRYVIHTLSLTESERQAWIRETAKIGRALAVAGGEQTQTISQLLIRRARIIKKAAEKPRIAASILCDAFHDGDAWLVYCDDTAQLGEVRSAIEATGLHCMEYHRRVGGAEEEALAEFARSGGIMLAIRCLDEGVDIPRIDHALILASSTTRREYIQRRGRVLRRADRKYRAEIHDILVDAEGFDDAAGARYLRSEVARAREFAGSACDSAAAMLILEAWERRLADLGLSYDPIAAANAGLGFEDSEGGGDK